MSKDLQTIREDINLIDQQLVTLIEKRLELALDVASYKKAHDLPILDAKREAEVLDRNVSRLNNPERYGTSLRMVLQCLMDESKIVQENHLK